MFTATYIFIEDCVRPYDRRLCALLYITNAVPGHYHFYLKKNTAYRFYLKKHQSSCSLRYSLLERAKN